MTAAEIHPGWLRLSHLPADVVICPKCGSPQQDKVLEVREDENGNDISLYLNWRWDFAGPQWSCRRPSCMDPGRPQRTTQGQRLYPPMAH
jgi:hypothetical protein